MKLIITLSIALVTPLTWADQDTPTMRLGNAAIERNVQAGFPEPPAVVTSELPPARIRLDYGPLKGHWVDTETQDIYERENSETPLPCGPERVEWNRIVTYGTAKFEVDQISGQIQRAEDKMSGLSCDLVFHREIRDIRTTPTELDKRCAALDLTMNDSGLEPQFKDYYEKDILERFATEFPEQLPAFERQLAAKPEGSIERYEFLANAYDIFESKNNFRDDLNLWTTAVVDYDVLKCANHKQTYEAFIANRSNVKRCNNLGRQIQILKKDLTLAREAVILEAESKAALNACLSERLGAPLAPQGTAEGRAADGTQDGAN